MTCCNLLYPGNLRRKALGCIALLTLRMPAVSQVAVSSAEGNS